MIERASRERRWTMKGRGGLVVGERLRSRAERRHRTRYRAAPTENQIFDSMN